MRIFEGFTRGINLGGWLSQCDETTRDYYDSFITREDLLRIADMGLDHVRVPVDYTILETREGAPLEQGYAYLDSCVSWCREAGLHMLIDLHKTYGYSFDPLDRDMDREAFFYDETLQERFFALWRRIASRYAKDTDIVAFELLNEIVSTSVAQAWNKVADQAISQIRAIAPRAWIVVGGVRYNNVTSVPLLDPPKDDRIVYNFHCYEPMIFTHQSAYWLDNMPSDLRVEYPGNLEEYREKSKALFEELAEAIFRKDLTAIDETTFRRLFAPAVEAALANDVPLYCGEYGVIDQAPVESTLRWLRDIHRVFESYGIGRALWTYKKKDFGLVDPHYDPIRREMIELL